MNQTLIARSRFGLGATADEGPLSDPRGWLIEQLAPQRAIPATLAGVPTTLEALSATRQVVQARKARKAAEVMASETLAAITMKPPGMTPPETLFEIYARQVQARLNAALTTDTPFRERLVHFWTNHFAVSADKQQTKALVGPFEIEAIRANLDRSFGHMLQAVVQHPAMLLYLDNERSFGPGSALVQRRQDRGQRKLGLNENLAREILELYSLGVRTGYVQADVTELARAITGWSVQSERPQAARFAQNGGQGFAFYPMSHEPGRRTLLGKTYGQGGMGQGEAMLRDLARHPATARHIATKLVRHFVADEPPPAAVARLEQVFLETDGDLPSLHRALVGLEQAWVSDGAGKFKTPWDYVVSVGRLVDLPPMRPGQIAGLFAQLGQPVYTPGAPAGWPDATASWLSSDGLSKRIQLATQVGHMRGATPDARRLAEAQFGDALSVGTGSALANAESPVQALTLLLASPEMMRR